TDLTSPALNLHLARDAMGNIVALGNGPGANPATETYRYDPLYRLTGIMDAGTALESYTYNRTGDRLSKVATDVVTGGGAYSYTPGTHQLASIGNAARANDADGNTTASVIGGETFGFAYNGRNRLTLVQRNGSTVGTYTYNALGERIGKATGVGTASYAYDEAGHLIGDYTVSGKPKKGKGKHHHPGKGTGNDRDYVWLDDLPVAVIDTAVSRHVTTSTVNYVTADQLGTPRAVTDGTGTVIWSWAYQGNPFGEQQPTSSTGYVFNLRYPGQYYDAESNTNYNVFRTYEAATGRYLQSDPIGLVGGMSTYAYVRGDPLNGIDPSGLAGFFVTYGATAVGGTATGGPGSNPFATVTNESSGATYLVNGGVATGQVGAALFYSGTSGTTLGGFATGQAGALGSSPNGNTNLTMGANVPCNTGNMVAGGSVGRGVSFGFTNARNVSDLGGEAQVSQLDLGVLSLQYSQGTAADGTNIWVFSLSETLGLALSHYQTQTATVP
ncbi:MAG: RHS repeat-associated core domain-containing protein, partial [Rhodanobacter sp.]